MNDEHALFQDVAEPAQPVEVPVPVVGPTKSSTVRLWLIAIVAILLGLVGLFIWKILNPPPKPIIQVTQSPTPTPTPIRILSSIASESAFVNLTQLHASLSTGLSQANLDDPSLSPPVIELPLGFKP
ncbi:MAG: hypothetical protein Q8L37_07635 [Candidatus Gottesmanbacteria bacterium]|nr:hypothetical protein [Candidatus Gottesmanbacteria bacterium]